MSVHYVCQLKNEFSGPRYNRLKGISFEIQVRSLCMHAWAALSHYLEHKGEWDAPEELKKALNALSGLFYIADTQFEQVYREKVESQKSAEIDAKDSEIPSKEINLDTLMAYLNEKFPGREQDLIASHSDFILELKNLDIEKISDLDDILSPSVNLMDEFEHEYPTGDGEPYRALAAARIILGMSNSEYRKEIYGSAESMKKFAEKAVNSKKA